MPKLRRMRLVSIGHEDSRYSDVTLNFTNREGNPTNSVLWLRNGGGKSQLLGLFFAGIRPNKREFLGQRAEEKVRNIDDCVGKRDHGLVICEWELDAANSLFDERALFLSGVFYEWPSNQTDNGKTGVDRLFFSGNVSLDVEEMTLEGLPIYNQGKNELHRYHLKGFQRQLKRLDRAHPELEIVETDAQNKFMAELLSRGIDPEVFRYQISMNEREGGASELFSFSQDADFVDFVLRMAFSQQKANDVREQLATFREELVVRNEQLKPEKTYCEGLLIRLRKLVNIRRDREGVFSDTVTSHRRLLALKTWLTNRNSFLQQELKRLNETLAQSRIAVNEARDRAETLFREAAVNNRQACQLRFDLIDRELQQAKGAYADATRLKNIWTAARPLARCWDEKRQAKLNREQLARKQKQFAPDLARLRDVATKLANAIDFEIGVAKNSAAREDEEIKNLERIADELQIQSQQDGENAAKLENSSKQLTENISNAESEVQLLCDNGVLNESENANDGRKRIAAEIQTETETIKSIGDEIAQNNDSHKADTAKLNDREKSLVGEQQQLKTLEKELAGANSERSNLESNAALLRLLQVDRVDIESAGVKAVNTATEELRRIAETILRIRIESAEDERSMEWLRGDGDLLPPSQDVVSTLKWLREKRITAWSGWEYIENNTSKPERRTIVERLPFVANGIVVASKDYERVVEINAKSQELSLRTAITIVPTEVLKDANDVFWTVIGPTSDAHFDKDAAALELNQLESRGISREKEVSEHTEWQQQLSRLRERLNSFQSTWPRGWFASQRQRIEVVKAKISEAENDIARMEKQLKRYEEEKIALDMQLDSVQESKNKNIRNLDRVDSFVRQFGKNVAKWKRDLEKAQNDAMRLRSNQTRNKEKAESKLSEVGRRRESSTASKIAAKQLESELDRLKYVDEGARNSVNGSTAKLRTSYNSLLLEYEDKVNAETLEQLATSHDVKSQKERNEFERVLAQYSDIDEQAVVAELKSLDKDTTAEIRWEQAERDENAARAKSGNIGNQARPRREELEAAERECDNLKSTGELPLPAKLDSAAEYQRRSDSLRSQVEEHQQLAQELDIEIAEFEKKTDAAGRELDGLQKDDEFVEAMEENHRELLDRFRRYQPEFDFGLDSVALTIDDSGELARQLKNTETQFRDQRTRHAELDTRRVSEASQVASWSRQKRFTDFDTSISHQFADKDDEILENKSEFFITQLEDRILEIERKLEEADQHHDRVVGIVATAVDEALGLLKRVARMSKLPESLPQAGKHFIKITTKASDNPADRRAKIAELIGEIVETGEVGDGLQLIQKGVRQVAVHTKVGILHPDLRSSQRLSVSELKRKSGGERLTCAIMLFCALVKLRQQESGAKGTSVLLLDNPIGTASRVSFLDLQREVADSMNVQLVYATGVNDLNAISALENVVRLRNSRVDRRTNRRMVEVEGDGEWNGEVEAARVVFDKPAGSVVGMVANDEQSLSEVSAHESND